MDHHVLGSSIGKFISLLTNVCREIGQLFLKHAKNDVIQGTGWVGQNDSNLGQANSTGVLRDQKVNKAV